MLYGAIIGDIAGSIYEFDNIKVKPENIMPDKAFFTDDTVMTIAVADAINHDELEFVDMYMRRWGNKYSNMSYGTRFGLWLKDYTMGPYESFGNGSAMRTSPAAWAGTSINDAIHMARDIAKVSHNHPEGVKGAEAVTVAVYIAAAGVPKDYIKDLMENCYGYKIRRCDDIRKNYMFDETCQGTVPEAIAAFMESEGFEDCIKLAISLGGDSDTLACIAGSIAEAYYGVPDVLKRRCRKYLTEEMLDVIDEFERRYA